MPLSSQNGLSFPVGNHIFISFSAFKYIQFSITGNLELWTGEPSSDQLFPHIYHEGGMTHDQNIPFPFAKTSSNTLLILCSANLISALVCLLITEQQRIQMAQRMNGSLILPLRGEKVFPAAPPSDEPCLERCVPLS